MPSPALQAILQAVASGSLSVAEALPRADAALTQSISGATVDLGRAARCRFGEVIYGEGKSESLIGNIAEKQLAVDQDVLVTRIAPAAAEQVCQRFAHHRYRPAARTLRLSNRPIAAEPIEDAAQMPAGEIHVAILTAGSTDEPVAAEALETLHWMGVPVCRFTDVGVAGPQRLLAIVPQLRAAAAVIVVAGMEGALPSVVGGYVACPVIAVPTSVGYGSAFAGLTPLLGMLTSCEANVSVVGIDAGFKGGYVAGLIATGLRDLQQQAAAAVSPGQV